MVKKDKTLVEVKDPLDLVIAGLDKKYGQGTLFTLQEGTNKLCANAISTGLLGLDEALGIWGWPEGRIIEIVGPESSGKSTLCLSALVAFQNASPDRHRVYIDMEHSLDLTWMKKLGVRFDDHLKISQPQNAEQALEIAEAIIVSGRASLVVIDSVAALVPEKELGGEMSDQQIGLQARLMSKFFRKVHGTIPENNTTVILINQIRQKISSMPGANEAFPGGNALKFYAHQRLRIARTGPLKLGEDIIGNVVQVEVKKNKLASPFKTAILPLLFRPISPLNYGFSPELSMFEAAVNKGIFRKKGSWYSYGDRQLGQGSINVARVLKQEPELFQQIYQNYKKSFSGEAEPPPELEIEGEEEDGTGTDRESVVESPATE